MSKKVNKYRWKPWSKHLLKVDAWIDSTLYELRFRAADAWESISIFSRRFRVTGFKRCTF